MATQTLDKPQTRDDWKARSLNHYYGQVTAITPENGLMRITVSNPLGSMDFHADPRSCFVKMAETLLRSGGAVQDITYRRSERAGNRDDPLQRWKRVPSFEIVAMKEAKR